MTTPPSTSNDLDTATSSSKSQRSRRVTTARLNKLDIEEMLRQEPPPVPWLVEPLLVRGCLTLLAGREGQGKSLVAQALAVAIVSGQPMADLLVTHGNVLIVDAENSRDELHRRLRSFGLAPGSGRNLAIYEAESLNLRHGLDLARLQELVAEQQPDLLILDSLRSIWRGDENSSAEAGPVIDGIRNLCHESRVAGLVLHHSPKNESVFRGSTAIAAAAELVFYISRAEADPDPARRSISCHKSRPAPEPETFWVRIEAALGQLSIEEANPGPQSGPERAARDKVKDQLAPKVRELLRTDGELRRAEIARGCGRPHNDRTIGRVLDELVATGEVAHVDSHFRLIDMLDTPDAEFPAPESPEGEPQPALHLSPPRLGPVDALTKRESPDWQTSMEGIRSRERLRETGAES
jgi:archaellum biogenesis ATPase FlaH